MMIYTRSLIFLIGQILITILYFPLTLVGVFLPDIKKVQLIAGWGKIVSVWLKLCCNLDYRVSGSENLPNQAFVVLAKHQSAWETFTLLFLLPPNCWVLKKELLKIPFFGWGLALARPIAIDRNQSKAALKQLLSQGKQRIESGLCVVICPEGTRMSPGQTGKYNVGGAMLAKKSNAQVVPVAHNSGSFWARKGLLKKPGTIDVVIGKPIDTHLYSVAEINQQAKDWIEATVKDLEADSLSTK